jgi:hypothetical protein
MPDLRLFAPSRATLRKISLMRRCQPGPRLRKCATTSRSSRSETSCLVGAFCGPRRRRYAATISGATSMAGRARAHISSVISNASGSAAIPAAISASSASVIVASWRSALRRASRHNLSCSLDIFSHVTPFSFPQTDDSDAVVSARENKNMQSHADVADCDLPQLAVLFAVIDKNDRGAPIEFGCSCKIYVVFPKIRPSFGFVPFIDRCRFHGRRCNSEYQAGQSYCSYDLPSGALT